MRTGTAQWLHQNGLAFDALRKELIDCGCKAAFAFGSTVRGDATTDSDIDIAVVGTALPNLTSLTSSRPLDVHLWSTLPGHVSQDGGKSVGLPVESLAWAGAHLGHEGHLLRRQGRPIRGGG